jgi:hypothetical protein
MDLELLEGVILGVLDGVREYGDGDPVELRRDVQTGRLKVVAWNECGNNTTGVDVIDLVDWLRLGPQASRVDEGFSVSLPTMVEGCDGSNPEAG